MTTPGFRKRRLELEKLITTPWLKDANPFNKMNPKPRRQANAPLQVVAVLPSASPPAPAKRVKGLQTTPDKYQQLMARDGINCWLCHEPLGADMTIEHLLASAHGGPSHMANYVLTHARCNHALGVKPVADKVRMREERR